MAAFSATDVAFEGFRITRERPLDVLAWVALFIVFQVVLLLAIGPAMGQLMSEFISQSQAGAQPSPERIMAAYARLGPAYAIVTPVSLIVQTLVMCAIYRAVLRPQERGVAGMRLGGDELRVLAVSFAIGLLIAGGVFIAVLLIVAIAGGVGYAGGEIAGALVGVLLGAAALCAPIYVGTRLSLATPMTFAAKDFRVFESWRATKGRFWSLLGAYFLAFVMGLLVNILIGIVSAAAIAGTVFATGTPPASPGTFDPTFLTSPVTLVTVVFQGIASAFFSVILYAPPAAALRALMTAGRTFD